MVGSVSGNLSHPVYARQISAWDRRGLAGPSAWTQLLSFSLSHSLLSAPCLPRFKDLSLQTVPHHLLPINTFKPNTNKLMPSSLGPRLQNYAILVERIPFTADQMWPSLTAPPLISKYGYNTAMLSYLQCPGSN